MGNKFFYKVIFFGAVYKNTNIKNLKKTFKSIFGQKFIKPKIYIFCDGKIPQKLIFFLKGHNKLIKVYKSQNNLGLGNALNFLVNKIKNLDFDYFSRFDDDDYFHDMKTFLQINYMKKKKINICGTWAIEKSKQVYFYKTLPIDDQMLKKKILFRSPFIHSSVIFDKKVFRIFNYDKKYNKLQDYKLWLEISQSSFKIIFGNIPLYLTTQNLSEDFYYKRGYLIAIKELLLRLKFLKHDFKLSNFLLIILLFLFRVSPESIKKIAYEKFR